ncbi:uncharacterized protein LOC6557759 [Drosophila grimshawi]|nr:uncharacterized protein LOC6557759 [Drosophila grimshawi]
MLTELHALHIVFITASQPSAWQQDLYAYCFREGFINVLLIHKLNQTLSLYSYNPYPEIRITKLGQVGDYLNRWHQLRDLQQYPIRIISFESIPRTFRYVNRRGQLVQSGYMHHVFLEFARRHNGTVMILKELKFSEIYENYLVYLKNKTIDVIYKPMESELGTSGTTSLYLLKMHIMVPHARPIASYIYLTRPFTWTVWLAVIGSIGYGMLMLCRTNGNRGPEIGRHFLHSWCHILYVAQPMINIANWQQYAIHFILISSGLILTTSYLAQLSSMLTAGLFEPQYNTLEDLARAPYKLIMSEYFANYLMHSDSVPPVVRNHIQTVPSSVVENARLSLNTSFMYIGYSDRIRGILYQQHLLKVPRFKMMTQSLCDGLMSFPVAPGLPYLNILNIYIRRIFESGILKKMRSDSWRDVVKSGITKLMRGDGVEEKHYDLEFYFYVFALWAIGLGLSVLCFILELLRKRMTLQNSQTNEGHFN